MGQKKQAQSKIQKRHLSQGNCGGYDNASRALLLKNLTFPINPGLLIKMKLGIQFKTAWVKDAMVQPHGDVHERVGYMSLDQ